MSVTTNYESGVTDARGRGARRPPGRLNVKNGPLLACILVFNIIFLFSRFLFLAVFKDLSECFPVISGVSTDESS